MQMQKVDPFWAWVQERMEELSISSFRELEKKAGFKNGAIGRRKNEHKFPTTEMAEGLCRALRVDWVELWSHAGYVDQYGQAAVNPRSSDLQELDAEIYQALHGQNDAFKRAVLKTIKTWLAIYEES